MSTTVRSTLIAVGERAGVSSASVSRVVNGLPTSAALRERVELAARELEYAPHAVARALKFGRTEQIALAVADVGNPVYVSMMHAVSGMVGAAGFRLVIFSTGNGPDDQIDLVRSANRGFVDGLILVPLRLTSALLDELAATRLPVTVIGNLPDAVRIDSVRADSPAGVGLAMDHLYAEGRRRVAFINGPLDTVPGTARLAGYLAACERLGLVTTPDMQTQADDFTFEAGLPAAEALLNQVSPDAVICANDLLAVAAIKVLAQRGRRVPDDVALVGMDDTKLAELVQPSLTSVDLRSHQRAVEATSLLLSRLANPSLDVRQVRVAPGLTVRESSTVDPRLSAANR